MESNKRKCKVCGEEKDRTLDGSFDEHGKNKRWRDEDGLLWNGKVCGSCNRNRVKESMKKLYNSRKDSNEEKKEV